MKENIPNALTVIRLILASVLPLSDPTSPVFLTVVAVCGITDVFDGFLARRWNIVSRTGSMLDSVADVAFITVLVLCLLAYYPWEPWMLIWVAAIAVIRIAAFAVGYARYGVPGFVHTYLNKAAGLMLFFSPFIIILLGFSPSVILICSVATVSSLEFLYINLYSKDYDPDRKTILIR
ncbi:MAG: CDP-alcohol phosphatidyltransferase family protein [Candidatus Methanomethylophilaceae archaeon]|nr:CDP-alcohol phosphatidyltransferase family protein [Candidatus Methanomethylophilaceae archaeon]MBP5685946.1 CDP-alcohol phosphatidyltransferase family protein [Candidatus Methanomethylophilaceae archaeon]MBP5735692.1 CDP-alcohol phosphatidyltransferase family protein [Candidatus Methanomethylophilaceae archaeon]